MTTLERVEQIKKDLIETVEAKQKTHVQINQVLEYHLNEVKNEKEKK